MTLLPALLSSFKILPDLGCSKRKSQAALPETVARSTGMSKDVGRQVTSILLIRLLYKGLELILKSLFLYLSGAAIYSISHTALNISANPPFVA